MTPLTEVTLATDGSCLRNPGGATGWAWVAEDGSWEADGAHTGTNQTAELQAVLMALRDWPTAHLVIQIDSQYALTAATTYGERWAKNGWRTATGNSVANLALVKGLHLQMTRRRAAALTTRFVKVPGHDPGNRWPLNTAADEHARRAARHAAHRSEPPRARG